MENQPGAAGIPGTHAMIKSPADGFTISLVSNNHVIYPSVYKALPFDPVADITAITVIGSSPLVLVVNPAKVPARTARELAEFFKAKPGAYNYASSVNGTRHPYDCRTGFPSVQHGRLVCSGGPEGPAV